MHSCLSVLSNSATTPPSRPSPACTGRWSWTFPRVTRNRHDAEDAFQTAFLVLIRKAASIASPARLPNWLYGVANNTALKARATAQRRRRHETQVDRCLFSRSPTRTLLERRAPPTDLELSRLPDKYRIAIVLCDLDARPKNRRPSNLVARKSRRRSIVPWSNMLARGWLAWSNAHGSGPGGHVGLANGGGERSAWADPGRKPRACICVGQASRRHSGEGRRPHGRSVIHVTNKLKITTAVCLLAVLTSCGAAVLTLKAWGAGQIHAKERQRRSQSSRTILAKSRHRLAKTVNSPITGTLLHPGPPRVLAEHKSPLTCLAWSPMANGWLPAPKTALSTSPRRPQERSP